MSASAAELLVRGREAQAAGDLASAATAFRGAIELEELPLARLLLGGLCYADDRFEDARRHWEAAFRGFRDGGELQSAARAATNLVDLHSTVLGNVAAGRGWIGRATRLLERVGPCVEWGYLALAVVACDVPDIASVEHSARVALEMALEFGDSDLEVRALADSGLALVSQGRVGEGFARLDEAMVAITADEVRELSVAGKSFCAMLTACDRTGDSRRAEEWTRLVAALTTDRLGGRPRVLYTHCRSAYGSVLCSIGRWPEAEAAMLEALDASSSVYHQAQTCSHLADLRLLQGRNEEAGEILRPYEDRVEACGPLARLHISKGEFDLAGAVLRRGLKMLVADRLRQGPLLAQLVEVELARDDLGAAAVAAERLEALAGGADSRVLKAEAALARGRVEAARAAHALAVALFEEAQGHLGGEERPVLCGAIRYELSRALREAGDLPAAISEARAAMAVFERLGAEVHIDRTAALLRSLGVPGRSRSRASGAAVATLTPREREVLNLVRLGLTNAEIGSRLYITPKTAEHHVGRVLTKLGVRRRAEAAAIAAGAARDS
jgi:DNA-binding CsgD family transcriptional regulator